MIPNLQHTSPVQAHYLDFLNTLSRRGFKGDISPDYANRTVLATDNSIYQVLPQGVVYPKHTGDLILITQLANEELYRDIVLSPRGGGTGTNGQSLTDGIVVDISRHMNQILEINVEERWVKVQTGVVKDQLNAFLKPHGLFFAPELSTSNRATIGGMINTDASGQGSCLYGKTRNHVLELQTVLLDGSVLNSQTLDAQAYEALAEQQDRTGLIHRVVDSIYKEHKTKIDEVFPPLNRCLTGYDLAHIRDENGQFNLNNILCGSEGTLGFITEAKLNLLTIPKHSALVVVKYGDFEKSLRDATELMKAKPTSIETIDSKVLNLAMNDFVWHQVEEFFPDDTAEPVQGINFVEYTADDEAELDQKVQTLLDNLKASVADPNSPRIGYALAKGSAAVNRIWGMRKRAVGLLGNKEGEARPVPFVEDTAVPPEHLADFIMEFREILDAYKLEYGMFGHVDAGVLHVRPALDMKDPEQAKIAWEISDRVADLTHQYHGLLWGEHGKGVRSEYAPQFFGELYPQLQRIKATFDPYNQLNPGKIATPSDEHNLLKINEVTTRGELDRVISKQSWTQFEEAVYCNGNGACFNWNTADQMCPSYKVTRQRVNSPKGRASLIREWLKLLSENNFDTVTAAKRKSALTAIAGLPKRLFSSLRKKLGVYDFSHEVYDSMAACLACKSCTGQCPIKVDVPEFRSKFLSLYHTRYMRPLKDYLVGALEFMLPVCAKFPGVYNFFMKLRFVQLLLEKWVGFVDGPLLTGTRLAGYKLTVDANGTQAEIELASPDKLANLTQEQREKTVVIVQDAFTSYFETQLVIDTIQLLKQLGFNALLAPYKANGKPLHVHGFLGSFADTAEKNAKMLNSISACGVALVGIDPSMTLTYRSEYKKYLSKQAMPKVELLQEFLDARLLAADTNVEQSIEFKLMPHCTETSNAVGTIKMWQSVFTKLGHSLTILNAGCCGMSGTYGHEARNKESSQALYQMSWQKPVEQHAPSGTLLATGYSCRSQVKREAGEIILHPVQALLANITVS